jgi:alpha-D-ribose 1-methylphosphonate 5-triphosphate synthase subunit PhnH
MNAILLQPAFKDPVLDAQRSFRAALDALARPGVVQTLMPAQLPPALHGLDSATHALCLALLDLDTPLWLAPAFDTPAIRANLAFHCGCPLVSERRDARFALLDGTDAEDLSGFDAGNDRYPDQSCTLLVQLSDLNGGPRLHCSGPGVEQTICTDLPVPERFWGQRAARNEFPRGLDVFFLAGSRIIGLPRSTRVQERA